MCSYKCRVVTVDNSNCAMHVQKIVAYTETENQQNLLQMLLQKSVVCHYFKIECLLVVRICLLCLSSHAPGWAISPQHVQINATAKNEKQLRKWRCLLKHSVYMAILSQPFRMHAITSQLYVFLQCINTKHPKHKNMQVTNKKENHVDFSMVLNGHSL